MAEHAIEEQMRKAALKVLKDVPHLEEQVTRHYTEIEAVLYATAMASVLVYGCEAWPNQAYYGKGGQVGWCMERQTTFIYHRYIERSDVNI